MHFAPQFHYPAEAPYVLAGSSASPLRTVDLGRKLSEGRQNLGFAERLLEELV